MSQNFIVFLSSSLPWIPSLQPAASIVEDLLSPYAQCQIAVPGSSHILI